MKIGSYKIDRSKTYYHKELGRDHYHVNTDTPWSVTKIGVQFVYIQDRYGRTDIVTPDYFRKNFIEGVEKDD